jgi:HlyD family secretion protein
MFQLNFRTIFWGGSALIVVILLVLALIPHPEPVDIAEVVEGPMAVSVRDEGYTRVREVYVVSAPLGGRLLRVDNDAGDTVAAGDIVANILPSAPAFLDARSHSEAEAAVRSAEAALAFSRAEVDSAAAQAAFARAEEERMASLFETGIASRGAIDRVRMELRTAVAAEQTARSSVRMRGAELEAAQARLNVTSGEISPPDGTDPHPDVAAIRAPVDGRVLRVLQESESVVAAGSPILEIGDPADLEIVVELLSTDAVQVTEGDRVDIVDWDGSDTVLHGRVRVVEPYGFQKYSALGVEEQRVNIVIDLIDAPGAWGGLGHGFRIEAAIIVWEEASVIQVPVSALFRTGEDWQVFIIEDGVARSRTLQLGRLNGQTAQITAGLTAGQSIIRYPGDLIADGTRVTDRARSH